MNLKNLSDINLHNALLQMVEKEREIVSKILWHLKEIDRRKLYSDYRCSSLFDYCVYILKYSEGQASRRVNASRLLNHIPEIINNIETGSLTLTQINQANKFFKDEKINSTQLQKEILKKIENKSTRETEKVLWELKSNESPRKIQIELEEQTVNKLKEVQALQSHTYKTMDQLLMAMSFEISKIWDPTIFHDKKIKTSNDSNRHISKHLKSIIWKKNDSKCSKCGSKHLLEIDHIKPFSLGGKTNFENLRLLCRNCNQREGYKYFGDFKMRKEKSPPPS